MNCDDVPVDSASKPADHRKNFGERDLRDWKVPISKCSRRILLIDEELKQAEYESAAKKSSKESHEIGRFRDSLRERGRRQDHAETSNQRKTKKRAKNSPRRNCATTLNNPKTILLGQTCAGPAWSVGL